jgi:hypothetical protein
MRRACLGIGVLAVALASGCGGDDDGETTTTPAVDPAAIEPQLLENLAADVGVDPSGDELDCPEGEPAEEGHQFNCTLTASDGSTATVRVTVTSAVVSGDTLDYDVEAVVPKGQFK